MNKVKEFMKKNYIIPYIITLIVICVVAYLFKWHHHPKVYQILKEDAKVVYSYFNLFFAIVVLGFSLIYFMVVKKSSIEKLYLTTGIVLGILFMFIVTPFAAADESNHIYTCYDMSNIFFGYEKPEDEKSHWLRECDAYTEYDKEISIENYYYTAKNFWKKPNSTEMVLFREDDLVYKNKDAIYYFPAIFGITVCRVFGASDILTFTVARVLMFGLYMAITYFAIKKMPVFKAGFALLMLMPGMISRAAAVTYDGPIMAYIFLFVAYVMYYIYSKEKFIVRDIVIMVLAGVTLTVGKGGVYIPLLLMLFLIPKDKFGTRVKYPVIVAVAILLCLGVFLLSNRSLFSDMAASTAGSENNLAWSEEEGYTIKAILMNPVGSFKLLGNTLITCGYKWYGEMIGDGFGWLQIYVSPFVHIIYSGLFILAALNINGEEKCLEAKTKYVLTGIVVLTSGLVILSMWIFWTPLNYPIVAGIQGRYFIPIFLLLVLMMKNKTMVIKKDMSRVYLLSSYLVGVLACFYIWIGC